MYWTKLECPGALVAQRSSRDTREDKQVVSEVVKHGWPANHALEYASEEL